MGRARARRQAVSDILVDACRGWIRHARGFNHRCLARANRACDVEEVLGLSQTKDGCWGRIIIRAQASKAQGPIDFLRILIFFFFFFFFFFYSTIRVLLRALTCSKTLENSHTRWNPLASGRHRGWDPGVAQGLYGAP